MKAARHPHSFLGIDQQGLTSVVKTTGNQFGHVVLRGGRITDTTATDAATVAVREVTRQVRDDERLVPVLLPVGDGLLCALRR